MTGRSAAGVVRRRVLIRGVVQGVGFRPFLFRRATEMGLAGWVANVPEGVVAEIEGGADQVGDWIAGLAGAAPSRAIIERIDVTDLPPALAGPTFEVRSTTGETGETGGSPVAADVATCAACQHDVADPTNRRYRHPFASCVECGPRFTIATGAPYGRLTTTMDCFAMCAACAAEYHDPASRRFHAETIACPRCGPVVAFTPVIDGVAARAPTATAAAAVEAARRLVRAGGIVAVKGLGGFQLWCDATNATAVARLRDGKRRPAKPFAVLVRDVAAAQAIAHLDEVEQAALAADARPIVLLDARTDGGGPLVAPAVAPGTRRLGIMLPCTPLHDLLAADMPPLVCTSGNVADEPILHDDAEAARRLAPLVDGLLGHDRRIETGCDDSVVQRVAAGVVPLRRSRGFVPQPVPLPAPGPDLIAVGGDLKNAVGVACGDRVFLSQHLGDLGGPDALAAFERAVSRMLLLCNADPVAVVADLHPGYLSTAWARRFAAERGLPLIAVQHHEAHVASLLAEQGTVLAGGHQVVCFDGTGYGRDGTVQGGEWFTAVDRSIHRAAHLLPFRLPGGDACIRRPWRTALAVLHAAGLPWDPRLPAVRAAGAAGPALRRQLDGGVGCATTTSMGRLFDAVASLVGLRQEVRYEAEAALNLESAAAACHGEPAYAFQVCERDDGPLPVVDWRPAVAAVVRDVVAGVPAPTVAARFHEGVASLVVETCARLRATGGGASVGLTGGVFQNVVLAERCRDLLAAQGFVVMLHRIVPPNDGGLALGQAMIARWRLAGGP